jgi:hypothetical protein
LEAVCRTQGKAAGAVYETKPHSNKASALKRAFAIYRNAGWGLRVLFIEGTNGERIEAAEINAWCERASDE